VKRRGRTATLGLTGSIGMGKSTAARMFHKLGVPVHDADAAVHALFRKGGAGVGPVGEAFPEAVRDGAVDRAVLGKAVFGDPERLARLEAIVHPLVRRSADRVLRRARARRARLAVFDVPLLFETGAQTRYDAVAVVSAPAFVQAQRVLARPGMTAERLAAIRARQTADAEKRRRADFVLPTGLGRRCTLQGVRRIVRLMTED
jgi:dephospho-CoA kinase